MRKNDSAAADAATSVGLEEPPPSRRAARWTFSLLVLIALTSAIVVVVSRTDAVDPAERGTDRASSRPDLGKLATHGRAVASDPATTRSALPSGAGRVVARSIEDASPLANLRLVAAEDGGTELSTDEVGSFEWNTALRLPESATPGWRRIGDFARSDPRFDRPVAWFARRVEIRGRIVPAPGQGEISPEEMRTMSVRLDSAPRQGRGLDEYLAADRKASAGEMSAWTRSSHARQATRPRRFDRATGEFEFAAVVVENLGIRAVGRGWSCRTVRIDERIPPATGEAYVRRDVVVWRRPRMVGRVLDDRGAPTEKAQVKLHLRGEVPSATFDPEWYAGYGFSVKAGGRTDGVASISLTMEVESDEQGRFEIEGSGELEWPGSLVVLAGPDALPIRTEFAASRTTEPVEFRWTRSASRVRLLRGGVPVRDTEVALNDLTERRWQTTLANRLRTDGDGWMSSAWLEPGRDYGVFLLPLHADSGSGGIVRWRGQAELELGTLPRNVSEFDADPNR